MRQELKISFDTPEYGWLAIYLDSGDHHLKLPFSYTPFDVIGNLKVELGTLNLGAGLHENNISVL